MTTKDIARLPKNVNVNVLPASKVRKIAKLIEKAAARGQSNPKRGEG